MEASPKDPSRPVPDPSTMDAGPETGFAGPVPAPDCARDPNTLEAGVRIVLVRPQGAGNIGSVARVMANFGLSRLYLVAPRADPLGFDARAMACSAQSVLEHACRTDSLVEALAGCRWVCGTTARVGERRHPELTARSLGEVLLQNLPAALVFGPEDAGLPAEDLDLCHTVLTIPTAPRLHSLNLAQAVAIVAYELWVASISAELREPGPISSVPGQSDRSDRSDRREGSGVPDRSGLPAPSTGPSPPDLATAEELEATLDHLRKTLDAIGYFRQTAPEHPMREIRRFLARARPSREDLARIRGMCRKALNALRYGPPPK